MTSLVKRRVCWSCESSASFPISSTVSWHRRRAQSDFCSLSYSLAMGRSRGKTTGALVGGALQQTRPSSGDDGDEEMVHWNENSGEGSARMNQVSSRRRRRRTFERMGLEGSLDASFSPPLFFHRTTIHDTRNLTMLQLPNDDSPTLHLPRQLQAQAQRPLFRTSILNTPPHPTLLLHVAISLSSSNNKPSRSSQILLNLFFPSLLDSSLKRTLPLPPRLLRLPRRRRYHHVEEPCRRSLRKQPEEGLCSTRWRWSRGYTVVIGELISLERGKKKIEM